METILGDGPFFNGDRFNLVDIAYAPAFQRLELLERRCGIDPYADKPKVRRWAEACLQRQSVWQAVPEHFEEKLLAYIRDKDGYGKILYM